MAQQIVEATPFDDLPALLIRDGDPLYGQTFSRRTYARRIRTIRIPRGGPQCNGYVRSALVTGVLDHVCLKSLAGPRALLPR